MVWTRAERFGGDAHRVFRQGSEGEPAAPRTLCLPYDDGPGATEGEGPGPQTLELARFLHLRGVPATFFVIGRHAVGQTETLAQLRAWGHTVVNHSYSHPGLAELAVRGGDVMEEVARTDAVIGPHVAGPATYLRAPYGNWRARPDRERPEHPDSVVADALTHSGRFARSVGPINWDLTGLDHDFWAREQGAEACARAYLERIEASPQGIVLMHDSSESEHDRAHNRSLEVTRVLVPRLQGASFRFVGLEDVPQVRPAWNVLEVLALRTESERYLQALDGQAVSLSDAPIAVHEPFGLVRSGDGEWALRTSHGLFVTAGSGPEVHSESPEAGPRERFSREGVGGGRFLLKACDGGYVAWPEGEGGPVRLINARREGRAFTACRIHGLDLW